MKVIIAGSRGVTDYDLIKLAVNGCPYDITEVVSGTARGADKLGELWAHENNIPIKQFKPEWDKFGKFAGYYRNKQMGNYADALIAIWDGQSKGTKQMIDYMVGLKKGVYIQAAGPTLSCISELA